MLILIGSFLVLMILGLPVALSMAVASLLYILASGTVPDVIVAQRMIAGVESFPLLAVPFFILAGNLMNAGGMTDRIFGFARALVGHVRGGLAHVSVLASMLFAGVSGAALAEAMGLGTIEVKAMKDGGFDKTFAGAVVASSSTALSVRRWTMLAAPWAPITAIWAVGQATLMSAPRCLEPITS